MIDEITLQWLQVMSGEAQPPKDLLDFYREVKGLTENTGNPGRLSPATLALVVATWKRIKPLTEPPKPKGTAKVKELLGATNG